MKRYFVLGCFSLGPLTVGKSGVGAKGVADVCFSFSPSLFWYLSERRKRERGELIKHTEAF